MADVLFNKNDYKILEALIEIQCIAPVASLTIKQLINITGMSLSKVRSVKDNFLLMNFIQEGSKDSNSKTYYVTKDGIEHFKSAFGFNDSNIEDMILEFNYDREGEE